MDGGIGCQIVQKMLRLLSHTPLSFLLSDAYVPTYQPYPPISSTFLSALSTGHFSHFVSEGSEWVKKKNRFGTNWCMDVQQGQTDKRQSERVNMNEWERESIGLGE